MDTTLRVRDSKIIFVSKSAECLPREVVCVQSVAIFVIG